MVRHGFPARGGAAQPAGRCRRRGGGVGRALVDRHDEPLLPLAGNLRTDWLHGVPFGCAASLRHGGGRCPAPRRASPCRRPVDPGRRAASATGSRGYRRAVASRRRAFGARRDCHRCACLAGRGQGSTARCVASRARSTAARPVRGHRPGGGPRGDRPAAVAGPGSRIPAGRAGGAGRRVGHEPQPGNGGRGNCRQREPRAAYAYARVAGRAVADVGEAWRVHRALGQGDGCSGCRIRLSRQRARRPGAHLRRGQSAAPRDADRRLRRRVCRLDAGHGVAANARHVDGPRQSGTLRPGLLHRRPGSAYATRMAGGRPGPARGTGGRVPLPARRAIAVRRAARGAIRATRRGCRRDAPRAAHVAEAPSQRGVLRGSRGGHPRAACEDVRERGLPRAWLSLRRPQRRRSSRRAARFRRRLAHGVGADDARHRDAARIRVPGITLRIPIPGPTTVRRAGGRRGGRQGRRADGLLR